MTAHRCTPWDIDYSAAPDSYRCTTCRRTWRPVTRRGSAPTFAAYPPPPRTSPSRRTA